MTETCPTCHQRDFMFNINGQRNNFCGYCGRKIRKGENRTMWIETDDGMFKYYRCSNCGHKEYNNKLTQCPSCKKEITT